MIEKWRSDGFCEPDLDFAVDLKRARRHSLLARPVDQGLLLLSRAVQSQVRHVYLDGNNQQCRLSYGVHSYQLGVGNFSQILRRGTFAPLNLWVNGKRLYSGVPQPLFRLPLSQTKNVKGGHVDILRRSKKGQVELIDRGISFPLGPIFGPVRVVARVTPQKGAPWPSRLVYDASLSELLLELSREVRRLSKSRRAP